VADSAADPECCYQQTTCWWAGSDIFIATIHGAGGG
jgi:hypothetical protein